MCNILDTKVIIYNVTSSDKPAFKEGHQLIANLAVTFFFSKPCNNFQHEKEDFICKQSDKHFPVNQISVGLYLFLDTMGI